LDIYHQKRIQANRICRRKKKDRIGKKIKQLNYTNMKRHTRKFYKDVRNLSNLPSVTTLLCTDKDGNILSERKKQILERRQQYFKELLNPGAEKKINSIKTHEGSISNLELEKPTYEEINEIIKNMKSNKAAGPHEILPEFILKNGGLTLKQKIHQLIVKIWKQEKIPCEWSERILCPMYKERY
jgi:mannosyltransferase OCH1-like enzyme